MRHFMKFYCTISGSKESMAQKPYPNFIPYIIVSLKHRQMVLYWDNETMPVH